MQTMRQTQKANIVTIQHGWMDGQIYMPVDMFTHKSNMFTDRSDMFMRNCDMFRQVRYIYRQK